MFARGPAAAALLLLLPPTSASTTLSLSLFLCLVRVFVERLLPLETKIDCATTTAAAASAVYVIINSFLSTDLSLRLLQAVKKQSNVFVFVCDFVFCSTNTEQPRN